MDDHRDLTRARVAVRRFAHTPDLGTLAAARTPNGATRNGRAESTATPDLVWLDSSLPEGAPAAAHGRARWSVLGWCDGPFGARFRHEDRRAHLDVAPPVTRWFGPSRSEDRPAFAVLADLLARTPSVPEPVDGCGFALGWAGYLGYELGRESGTARSGAGRAARDHPDAELRFVDRAVVVRDDGAAWALALTSDDEPAASAANERWLSEVTVPVTRADLPEGRPGLPTGSAGRVTRAAYEAAVETCRAEIREGNAFQVCLTTAFAVPGREDRITPGTDPHLDEYLRLRTGDPVPFGAYLRLGPLRVASRSPERFLRIERSGRVTAEPIKGTRRRSADPAEDGRVRAELASSAKDRAENVMIVDLLRNDLLRTAVPGSVHVERLCAVETYASVHQLVSTIGAVVRPGTSRAEIVRAAFPPGSMTGAPKSSAMAIADRLEGAPRGVYSGVLGYFSASGTVDLSVAIRTLATVVVDDVVVRRSFGAGGAVTWSSVPADEADEVETKTRSVLGGLGSVVDW